MYNNKLLETKSQKGYGTVTFWEQWSLSLREGGMRGAKINIWGMHSTSRPKKAWQQDGPTFPNCPFVIDRKISGIQSGITSSDDQQSSWKGCGDGNGGSVANTTMHTTGRRKKNLLIIHILIRDFDWIYMRWNKCESFKLHIYCERFHCEELWRHFWDDPN